MCCVSHARRQKYLHRQYNIYTQQICTVWCNTEYISVIQSSVARVPYVASRRLNGLTAQPMQLLQLPFITSYDLSNINTNCYLLQSLCRKTRGNGDLRSVLVSPTSLSFSEPATQIDRNEIGRHHHYGKVKDTVCQCKRVNIVSTHVQLLCLSK